MPPVHSYGLIVKIHTTDDLFTLHCIYNFFARICGGECSESFGSVVYSKPIIICSCKSGLLTFLTAPMVFTALLLVFHCKAILISLNISHFSSTTLSRRWSVPLSTVAILILMLGFESKYNYIALTRCILKCVSQPPSQFATI